MSSASRLSQYLSPSHQEDVVAYKQKAYALAVDKGSKKVSVNASEIQADEMHLAVKQ